MRKIIDDKAYSPDFWPTWLLSKGRDPLPTRSYAALDEAALATLAKKLAGLFRPGDVLALGGELGAGKTFFTRALAPGLGLPPDEVASPTFVLVMEHEDGGARLPLFHFDLYRLAGESAFYEAGLDEYFGREGLCAIEWAERAAGVLPEDSVVLELSVCAETPDRRALRLYWPPGRAEELRVLDAVPAWGDGMEGDFA